MLKERYTNEDLSAVLIPRDKYSPYPRAEERGAWESLPVKLRGTQIAEGEKYLDFEWPVLPVVRYMDFQRNGNRSRYEGIYFPRRTALGHLVIAECLEDKGRFLDQIANGIWCICEESTWVVPAHNGGLPDIHSPNIDLFSAETASLLAWTHYLLKSRLDRISMRFSERIEFELKRRILDPYLDRNDFWWMGFTYNENHHVNNWNPWINSNCLAAFLLMEQDARRRTEGIAKIMSSLDKFIDIYFEDGGCDEGPSYWNRAGASLFDCLELLYTASSGRIDVYDQLKIQNMGRYIYRVFIDKDYFINFADGGAKVGVEPYLVYRFGRRIKDPYLEALGSGFHHLFKEDGFKRIGYFAPLRVLPALFDYEHIDSTTPGFPYVQDVWMEGVQIMAAREKKDTSQGLYLAAKGGHNQESHNHNDVGHFMVYSDGEPVVVDIGVETYTAKTFSPHRYDIWTMQSAYHSLPTVNGVQQHEGKDHKAQKVCCRRERDQAVLSLDIAAAYPAEAGIGKWQRTCRLVRGDEACIEVVDEFELLEATKDVTFSLMTLCNPIMDSGRIFLKPPGGGEVAVSFDGDILSASSESIPIEDPRLKGVWGERLFRILFTVKRPVLRERISMRFNQVKD